MIIRLAKQEEFENIEKQRLSSYQQYENSVSTEHWKLLKTTLTSKSDQSPGVDVYVAEIDGQIAGSIVLFPSKSKAYEWESTASEYPEIRMLAVDSEFRSKGVGKALVQQCIDSSKMKGAKFIGLHTGSFMKDAIRLYEKMGFERVPSLDFIPMDDGVIVKAFRYNL